MKILKKNPELNFSSGFINKIKGFVYSIFVNIISVILACLSIVLMYDVLDLDLYFTKDINEYNSYIDINHYNNNNYINSDKSLIRKPSNTDYINNKVYSAAKNYADGFYLKSRQEYIHNIFEDICQEILSNKINQRFYFVKHQDIINFSKNHLNDLMKEKAVKISFLEYNYIMTNINNIDIINKEFYKIILNTPSFFTHAHPKFSNIHYNVISEESLIKYEN